MTPEESHASGDTVSYDPETGQMLVNGKPVTSNEPEAPKVSPRPTSADYRPTDAPLPDADGKKRLSTESKGNMLGLGMLGILLGVWILTRKGK